MGTMAYRYRFPGQLSDVGKQVTFYMASEDGGPLETRSVEEVYDETVQERLQRLDLSELPLECGYSHNWIENVKTLTFVSVLNLKECGLTQLPPEIATMKRTTAT